MSSDDMRVDLECFVNKGITEGWQGWPLKGQFACHHEGARSFYRIATETRGASRGFFERTFREDGFLGRRLGDFLG